MIEGQLGPSAGALAALADVANAGFHADCSQMCSTVGHQSIWQIELL